MHPCLFTTQLRGICPNHKQSHPTEACQDLKHTPASGYFLLSMGKRQLEATLVCSRHYSPVNDLVALQEHQLRSDIHDLLACSPASRQSRLHNICTIRNLEDGHPAVCMGRKQQRQRERGVFAAKVPTIGHAMNFLKVQRLD